MSVGAPGIGHDPAGEGGVSRDPLALKRRVALPNRYVISYPVESSLWVTDCGDEAFVSRHDDGVRMVEGRWLAVVGRPQAATCREGRRLVVRAQSS